MSAQSVSVAQMIESLGPGGLQRYGWRNGTKGELSVHFAAVQVRIADGTLISHGQHLPGRPAWLVGEVRASGERKYYFTNHPADTSVMMLIRAIKARWVCEQAHQQLKEELGLDHYEGRSWPGLHHHALLTLIAFAYLQYRRLRHAAQAEKKLSPDAPGPPPQPTLPAVRRAILTKLQHPAICTRCPRCGDTITRHPRE
jgi:SRSO17 transposase